MRNFLVLIGRAALLLIVAGSSLFSQSYTCPERLPGHAAACSFHRAFTPGETECGAFKLTSHIPALRWRSRHWALSQAAVASGQTRRTTLGGSAPCPPPESRGIQNDRDAITGLVQVANVLRRVHAEIVALWPPRV